MRSKTFDNKNYKVETEIKIVFNLSPRKKIMKYLLKFFFFQGLVFWNNFMNSNDVTEKHNMCTDVSSFLKKALYCNFFCYFQTTLC